MIVAYEYDCEKYRFRELLQSIFHHPFSLESLHTVTNTNQQVTFENDTKTFFQTTFHASPRYEEFREMYYEFVRSELFKLFPEETMLVVQKDPGFRVCTPDNTALGAKIDDPKDQIG